MPREINSFRGPYAFLSNFAPARVVLEGVTYPTVENAFQAAKEPDLGRRQKFQHCTPTLAKGYGKKIGLDIEEWKAKRVQIMEDLLRQKFQLANYKKALLETGDATLIEGNWWGDVFWGVCNGVGENMLGVLLMKIREELKK